MSERRRAPLVTIADLYGTGGSVIGTRVAERLEMPLLDHVIPEEATRRTGVSEDAIADGDEEPRSRVDRLFSVVARDDGHQAPDKYRTTSITRSAACGARSRKPWPRRRGRAAWRSDAQGSGLDGIERDAAQQRLERENKARIDYVLCAYGVQGLDPQLCHLMLDSTAVPWTRASS